MKKKEKIVKLTEKEWEGCMSPDPKISQRNLKRLLKYGPIGEVVFLRPKSQVRLELEHD
jgi:hypothetical protein